MSFLEEVKKGLTQKMAVSKLQITKSEKGLEMIEEIKNNYEKCAIDLQWYNLCKLVCNDSSGFGKISEEYKTAKNYMKLLQDIYKF